MPARAFLVHLSIQLRLDLRDRGTLLVYYLVPLLFFFVMAGVFSSTVPTMRVTLAAAMSTFAVTMGAVMGAPTPLVRMREAGTLRVLKVDGVPGGAVLAVHAVSAFLHLFCVSLIIYLASHIVFHAPLPQHPALYLAVLAALLGASISVGLAIGVTARGQAHATMLAMLIFLPSLLLSGVMFPSSLLPEPLAWLGYAFPATHALQSFYGFAYGMPTSVNPGLALAMDLGLGALALLVALWRFGRAPDTATT